jgi:hypothetical protein
MDAYKDAMAKYKSDNGINQTQKELDSAKRAARRELKKNAEKKAAKDDDDE